ncbi:uncharacterized protein L203_105946 [Cryptococcus depauperatus CBS 7841]|uniref:Uncharacterized protein n=1 Tax=Cryptococcus depauperatus CBS 7841 TaxID=1295531 RepID=A0A1E3IWU4_9TREE|nr:hypothetical protein L203_00652 [Cryptococcus depauperatus CBS 7841]
MSEYLAEQTPHLKSLHAQLALSDDILQADLARIEAAIKGVITSIIREREAQVDGLKDDIAQLKRDVVNLSRAVGQKGRDVTAASRRESPQEETLPRQLEQLNDQANQLKEIYDSSLAHIQSQQAQLNRLSILLGPPFQPSKPLQPIASSSRCSTSTGYKKRASTQTIAQAIASGAQQNQNHVWYDVGDDITEELDMAMIKAVEERNVRKKGLCQSLFNLLWLHSELALPSISASTHHPFPPDLLPDHAEEEVPGAYASFEDLLNTVITSNELPTGDCEEWPEIGNLEGMEGVEPEIGLMEWADEVTDLWNTRKEEHEAKIQDLYNLVEPLWTRLQVDQETMDCFVEMNRGSGEATIKAYEIEYERLLELRRASLSSFIESTRKEIDALQTELMLSPDERSEFSAYIDDDYTEELLRLHELEIERLRGEVESKAALLPKVREWHVLVGDEEELERNSLDPNRFSRRGGAMLREEKLRKRVNVLKPKIEMELLSLLPTWEEEHGRPFLVSGERVVSKIHDALEAKELAKEAKKRAKQGLGPPPAVSASSSRPLAPTKTVRATPSHSIHSNNSKSRSTRLGKRSAPDPTPSQPAKRKKATTSPSNCMGTVSNYGSSRRPICGAGKTVRSVSNRLGAGSPTPYHQTGMRSMSHPSATMFSSAHSKATPYMAKSNTKTIKAVGGLTAGGNEGNLRRKSFKPRPSVAPSVIGGGGLGGWSEEDEDVF